MLPLEPSHLVERQHVDTLHGAERRGECRGLRDVLEIVGQRGHQHVTHPDRPPPCGQPARERQRRRVVNAGQLLVTFRIPRLEIEQHQIDGLELGVAQPIAVVAIGVERGVDAHAVRGGEQLRGEPVLHQRLTPAQRETSGHDFQAVSVLAQLLGGPLDRNRDAVAHRPRVGVVAIAAPPHAAAGPRDDAYAWAIHGGAGRERVQESHVAGGESRSHVGFRQGLAGIDAKLEWTVGLELALGNDLALKHAGLPRGTSG